jgi:hypothetical protein
MTEKRGAEHHPGSTQVPTKRSAQKGEFLHEEGDRGRINGSIVMPDEPTFTQPKNGVTTGETAEHAPEEGPQGSRRASPLDGAARRLPDLGDAALLQEASWSSSPRRRQACPRPRRSAGADLLSVREFTTREVSGSAGSFQDRAYEASRPPRPPALVR